MEDVHGGRDEQNKGIHLQHLPWGENRPYNDGDLYNCLVIKTLMKDTEDPHYQMETINVVDEV